MLSSVNNRWGRYPVRRNPRSSGSEYTTRTASEPAAKVRHEEMLAVGRCAVAGELRAAVMEAGDMKASAQRIPECAGVLRLG